MIYSLLKKDFQMLISGKFFLVALGSLVLYTLFIHFGYIHYMHAELYHVYLYDPQGTQGETSDLACPVASQEELDAALSGDRGQLESDGCDGRASDDSDRCNHGWVHHIDLQCIFHLSQGAYRAVRASFFHRRDEETAPKRHAV